VTDNEGTRSADGAPIGFRDPGLLARDFWESVMSQFNPRMAVGRPVNNIYTGLAFISMAATLATMVYLLVRFMEVSK
jgi:hypothetical protein